MKKNLFTVMIAIAVFAASVLFYFGVISYYRDISGQAVRLLDNKERLDKVILRKNEVPSQKWIELYEKRQKELDNQIANGKGYYTDVDKSLEKWFSGLRINNDKPSFGDFKTMYLDKKAAKIKELKARKLYGVSAEDALEDRKTEEGRDLGFGEPSEGNLKTLQKHFWIQEFLFAAMMESNVVKCEQIDFPDKPGSFLYGTYIPFRLTVCIQSKDVPFFIYNLVKIRDLKDSLFIPVTVRSLSLSRILEEIENIPERTGEKPVPDKDRDAYKPEFVKLPISRLYLEGDVLDFDFTLKDDAVPEKIKPGNDKKGKSK